jgi:hypothetical protein
LWFQIRQPHLEVQRKLPHPGEHGRNMNRILIGLISIAFFFQSAVADTPEKTDLTPIQAG